MRSEDKDFYLWLIKITVGVVSFIFAGRIVYGLYLLLFHEKVILTFQDIIAMPFLLLAFAYTVKETWLWLRERIT